MLAQRSAIASSMTLIAREAQKLLSTFGLAHVARGFHLWPSAPWRPDL